MRSTHRILIVAAVSALFVAMLAMPAMAGPAGQFISKINSSRAAAGLAPVESYWDLADNARSHSNLMADRQELFHSNNLGSVTSGWQNLGENVGVNLDVAGMHSAFMNSSSHRANILGDYNYVGVGVTVDDAGFMWATIIFMKAAPGLNGGGETTTTTTAPPSTGPSNPDTPTTTTPPQTTTTTNPPSGSSTTKAGSVKAEVRASVPVASVETTHLRLGDPNPPAYAI